MKLAAYFVRGSSGYSVTPLKANMHLFLALHPSNITCLSAKFGILKPLLIFVNSSAISYLSLPKTQPRAAASRLVMIRL